MSFLSSSTRIDETIDALKSAWQQHPHLRLGQMLVWAAQAKQPCPEIFYAGDDKLLQNFRAFEKGVDLKALINEGRM